MLRWVGAILLTATPACAGDTLTGAAKVLDGDTLELQGRLIDLYGIDAPEAEQVCARADGSRYRCGQTAAGVLRQRIGTTPVSCTPKGGDRQERLTAVCHVGETDLSAWMVAQGQGHALALRDVTGAYSGTEGVAWGLGSAYGSASSTSQPVGGGPTVERSRWKVASDKVVARLNSGRLPRRPVRGTTPDRRARKGVRLQAAALLASWGFASHSRPFNMAFQ